MTFYSSTFPTPAGDFTVAVNEAGAVVASAFGRADSLPLPQGMGKMTSDPTKTALVRRQVEEYFAGERTDFDLSLAPTGSAFQQSVWAALREIPFGETRSYGDIAALLGSAARAVGRANATNPVCLIIPCHRVIGADGSLTGYAYGETVKRRLLDHEGALEPVLV